MEKLRHVRVLLRDVLVVHSLVMPVAIGGAFPASCDNLLLLLGVFATVKRVRCSVMLLISAHDTQ